MLILFSKIAAEVFMKHLLSAETKRSENAVSSITVCMKKFLNQHVNRAIAMNFLRRVPDLLRKGAHQQENNFCFAKKFLTRTLFRVFWPRGVHEHSGHSPGYVSACKWRFYD